MRNAVDDVGTLSPHSHVCDHGNGLKNLALLDMSSIRSLKAVEGHQGHSNTINGVQTWGWDGIKN